MISNNKIIVETERLILREFSLNDFDALFKIYSNPDIMKFYPDPYSKDKMNELISRYIEHYKSFGHSLWAMILKSENTLIGDCGIIRQIINDEPENEIGYHLHSNYWHQGYATEAAMACKNLGFKQFKYKKLISLIRPVNIPSINLAKRIGFKLLKEEFIFNYNHLVYGKIDK